MCRELDLNIGKPMKNRLWITLVLLLTIVLWASAFVGIRIGLKSYSPGALAFFRFMIASLCMGGLYAIRSQRSVIPLRHCFELGLIGLLGIGIYHVSLNYGEMVVSAGIASFIIGFGPVLTVLLAVFFLKERLSLGAWIGVVISFAGLFLMMDSEGHSAEMSVGVWAILVAAFMSAIHTVAQKRYLVRYHPIEVTAWILWGGTLSMVYFLPALWLDMQQASFQATVAVVYLGIFPAAIAYLAWGYVLQHMSGSQASLYLYAMPMITTALGIVCLDEKPSLLSLLGGFISLVGAMVAHIYRHKLQPMETLPA